MFSIMTAHLLVSIKISMIHLKISIMSNLLGGLGEVTRDMGMAVDPLWMVFEGRERFQLT